MRKVFILPFLAAFAVFQFNCTSNTAENANQTNVILPTPQSVQTNMNANVAVESTPLPTFTNADEALAEGKKLLDALETEKAVEALSQAVKLNPDLAEAHFNLGIAYSLIEKDEQDVTLTQVETTPTPPPARKTKKNAPPVRTKNSEKAFENSVRAYKKILVKNPKDDAAHFNLGRALNKLNEDEDAMKSLREAVKLKPDDSEYQIELGAIYIKLAQYDEAVTALKKAVSLDDANLQAQEMLEKAEAGRKRVDFGNKPKLPDQPKSRNAPKTKETPDDNEMPPPPPPPVKKN